MGSSVRHSSYPFGQAAALKPQPPPCGTSRAAEFTAVSIEFVAKPQEAHRVETTIPAAIGRALKYVTGFAGCLVMIPEQEARLVTVVTFWDGEDCVKRRSQNVRCVQALLAPYLDRLLRVQTMVAHLPLVPMIGPETTAPTQCSAMPDLRSEVETVCAT